MSERADHRKATGHWPTRPYEDPCQTCEQLLLDALDWSPPCKCGHDQGEHAPDGCLEGHWPGPEEKCPCKGYEQGVSGLPEVDGED